jgi:hypothetical protein
MQRLTYHLLAFIVALALTLPALSAIPHSH